ncbi:MAG TPA: tetratricopeptide repeat protein [Gemmatimonadaceae bacterium]|jgi:predicted negative regulator of RcsB-dependent stress response|nr:tetratricopeptide repeat protein [Gemmatimonadaceae bacterium]
MTRTGAAARPEMDERAQTILDWAEMHSRLLTAIAVGIVVIAGAFWFYTKSHEARARNAATALQQAELAVASGNLALAQSNLEKIVDRYDATRSGKQARLILAQVRFDRGQFADGIATLQPLTKADDKGLRASAYNLLGSGYEADKKLEDAAKAYQQAADVTPYAVERDQYLASAARALTEGGKIDEAKKLWSRLASDPASAVAAEARVRLGELEAKAVKQS